MASCLKLSQVLDETGRFNPVYDEETLLTLDADIILMAIGQKADLDFLNGAYEVETGRGRIKALDGNRTSVDGIFAGGDVTTGLRRSSRPSQPEGDGVSPSTATARLEPLAVEKAQEGRKAAKLASFDSGCRHSHAAGEIPCCRWTSAAWTKEDMGALPESESPVRGFPCFNCGCLSVNPSDMANMLYAYGARVVTSLRELDGAVFFAGSTRVKDTLKPGEIVLELVVPKPERAP